DTIAVGVGPFETKRDEMATRGPVVDVSQGRVLGDDQQVEPAVVVEVADGKPSTDAGYPPRGPTRFGDVDQAAASEIGHELGRHRTGKDRAVVVDGAVGGGQV